MKQATLVVGLVVSVLGTITLVDGCTLNPFGLPDYDSIPRNESGPSSSTGGGMGGLAGSGGAGGVGGLAGNGGTAGDGGISCICTDDGKECTEDNVGMACPDGTTSSCHSLKIAEPCSGGPGYICNLAGECKGDCLDCTDEPGCTARCNGLSCAAESGCKSNSCEQGVCCNASCTGSCRSCAQPGRVGSCTRMPNGLETDVCNSAKACDDKGECVATLKWPLGAYCEYANECASGACRALYCRSDVNEPCFDDVECATNLCDSTTKVCKSCNVSGATCHGGAACDTSSGRCKALLGQPATELNPADHTKTDCAAGIFSGYLCALPKGSVCKEHAECGSRNCINGTCSDFCTASSQCVAGTTCMNGSCKLLPGNYCYEDWLCQSGKCSGFPRRCEKVTNGQPCVNGEWCVSGKCSGTPPTCQP